MICDSRICRVVEYRPLENTALLSDGTYTILLDLEVFGSAVDLVGDQAMAIGEVSAARKVSQWLALCRLACIILTVSPALWVHRFAFESWSV